MDQFKRRLWKKKARICRTVCIFLGSLWLISQWMSAMGVVHQDGRRPGRRLYYCQSDVQGSDGFWSPMAFRLMFIMKIRDTSTMRNAWAASQAIC
jgi:hypothetical protein